MSGIQGWCEVGRCEGECARCGNAAGLRWFCGNPEDALTAAWSVGLARSAFDEQSFQWALNACHGLRVCVSMPEPGETWEERIHDEGAYCEASQVRVPRVWRKRLHPKVVWAYSHLVPWSWTSSKHSRVVVNKEGVRLKLLTPVDSCCPSVLLIARSVAT